MSADELDRGLRPLYLNARNIATLQGRRDSFKEAQAAEYSEFLEKTDAMENGLTRKAFVIGDDRASFGDVHDLDEISASMKGAVSYPNRTDLENVVTEELDKAHADLVDKLAYSTPTSGGYAKTVSECMDRLRKNLSSRGLYDDSTIDVAFWYRRRLDSVYSRRATADKIAAVGEALRPKRVAKPDKRDKTITLRKMAADFRIGLTAQDFAEDAIEGKLNGREDMWDRSVSDAHYGIATDGTPAISLVVDSPQQLGDDVSKWRSALGSRFHGIVKLTDHYSGESRTITTCSKNGAKLGGDGKEIIWFHDDGTMVR